MKSLVKITKTKCHHKSVMKLQPSIRSKVLTLASAALLSTFLSACGGGGGTAATGTSGGGSGTADTTIPVITLSGASTININQGETYNDAGATANDNVDGDVSGNIAIGGDTVVTSTVGSYTITYNVSDAAGNAAAQVTRTVNVGMISAAASYNMPPVNDTGLLVGGNYPDGNNLGCTGETINEQDCSFGRDKQSSDGVLVKVGAGAAGFDFTKLGTSGLALAIQNQPWSDIGSENAGTQWSCVKDNHTGLIWETKINSVQGSGLHSKNDLFLWYSTDASNNNGSEGLDVFPSGFNTCTGQDVNDSSTYCNTQAFVSRINAENLCGGNDWRLPNIHEAQSIVQYGKDIVNEAAIDTDYFPNFYSSTSPTESISGGNYWTSASWFAPGIQNIYAWYINISDNGGQFASSNGELDNDTKSSVHSVRLVRTAQ